MKKFALMMLLIVAGLTTLAVTTYGQDFDITNQKTFERTLERVAAVVYEDAGMSAARTTLLQWGWNVQSGLCDDLIVIDPQGRVYIWVMADENVPGRIALASIRIILDPTSINRNIIAQGTLGFVDRYPAVKGHPRGMYYDTHSRRIYNTGICFISHEGDFRMIHYEIGDCDVQFVFARVRS